MWMHHTVRACYIPLCENNVPLRACILPLCGPNIYSTTVIIYCYSYCIYCYYSSYIVYCVNIVILYIFCNESLAILQKLTFVMERINIHFNIYSYDNYVALYSDYYV